ncbi:MAG: hypothetical protein M4D80_23095 [Myxococcota bacterium]|nr:hypothetical protein [Myxococcota bacterium]
MESLRKISFYLGRWPVALAVTVVLAAAILLPSLGRPGLWENSERALADRVAPPEDIQLQQDALRARTEAATPKKPLAQRKLVSCRRAPPEDPIARSLTNRAMTWGRDRIADSDGGRKLPLALLGLLTVIATAGIAMRVARPRAGIVTAIVLLSMPLLVLQSRMLTSDIGTACGGALIIYGFLALRSARDAAMALFAKRIGAFSLATVDTIVGSIALCGGIVIGFLSGGALLGLLVPIGAVAAAGKLGIPFLMDAGKLAYNTSLRVGRRSKWTLHRQPQPYSGESYGPAFIATLAVIALVGVLAYQLYELKPPHPGIMPPARQVAGIAIVPEGCWSWMLGGVWRPEDDLRYVFDSSFEQIAYGTFPWGILGPIAMLLLLRDEHPKQRLAGALTLAWAGGAWIAAEAFHRKVGITIWAGFPALAVAIGVWIDAMLERRARAKPEPDGDATPGAGANGDATLPAGAMLLGLFLLLAVLDFGKDMQSFPEKLTSLLAGTESVAYPAQSRLLFLKTRLWVLALGMIVALGAGLSLMLWRPGASSTAALLRRLSTYGIAGALGASIVIAGFWSFLWHPRLAEHLSAKAMFETYKELRKPGDQLVILGELGHAPFAYADAPRPPNAKPDQLGYEKAMSRDVLVAALKRPNRVFAIAPQTELCSLHREVGDKPYFVIDDRNTRNLLFSNKVDGTTDKNPLQEMIVHTEPKQISKRPKARVVWDNKIELLGWSIPATVPRGSNFDVTIYYKILQPVGGNWTAIMHFDGAIRFSGDHKPIKDRCPTSTWQQGDYIIDTHTVVAGGAGHPLGRYELWIGFFTGTAPNFKNMTVSTAPPDMKDATDRVKLTTLILD